jgi:hypothetical protein
MYLLTKFSVVDIDVQLFNKTSTRLPEAIFVAFETNPSFGSNFINKDRKQQWGLSKVGGQIIDPHNVLLNGSQYHHGESLKFNTLSVLLVDCLYTSTFCLF